MVYIYTIMLSAWKKLDETSLLPNESFYCKLTGESITYEYYQHTQTVWKKFSIESVNDYHNMYNLSNELLLADIYWNFRKIFMNHYDWIQLCISVSQDLAECCIKNYNGSTRITKRSIHVVIDWSGIRGRIATISHRKAKANNEYMGTEFDPTKDSKFISYLHAKNFYGWAMSKQLPTSGFQWMTDHELDDWKHLCCFLEIDLEYPEDLNDLHNDYPRAPHRFKIVNIDKLIQNLHNKTNYVVHYENYTKASV